ncbi:MAG: hypothetical protein J1F04_01680 [Oscillospiraceae bacterium]|nr:hypothetical protein [Oscillospiraceae bacterium]
MIRKKKVAALCKKFGRLYVVTSANGVQWIGYGTTFYKMEGMPQMKPVEYAAAFDFSEKDINDSIIEDYGSLGDLTNDDCAEEIIVDGEPSAFVYKGETYYCYAVQGRAVIIPAAQLAPIVENEYTNFCIRETSNKKTVLCVKQGLCAEAIIGTMTWNKEHTDKIKNELCDIINAVQCNYDAMQSDDLTGSEYIMSLLDDKEESEE